MCNFIQNVFVNILLDCLLEIALGSLKDGKIAGRFFSLILFYLSKQIGYLKF